MPDNTTTDTIHGCQIVLALIADLERNGGLEDGALPPATKKEVLRIRKQLHRRIDNLLNPQPKARKPKPPHWLEYIAHYTRKPTVHPKTTVADVATATPLAVVPYHYAHIRLADKVRYKDGKRIVRTQYSGKAYPVIGSQHGFVLLDTGHGVIGKRRENVLYAPEYAAYIGNVTAKAA